jgi:ribonuclease-3 family protein
MKNYFQMNMSEKEITAFSNLSLAHVGDGVFELLCRSYLCSKGAQNVGNLHRETVNMVKATSQAAFADWEKDYH